MTQPDFRELEPNKRFSTTQAAHLSGLTFASVNELKRKGLVAPSSARQSRRGVSRDYTFGDVMLLKLVGKLADNGIQAARVTQALRSIRQSLCGITATSLPGSHVVTNGKDAYIKPFDGPIARTFDGEFAFAFVVDLGVLQQEIIAAIAVLVP